MTINQKTICLVSKGYTNVDITYTDRLVSPDTARPTELWQGTELFYGEIIERIITERIIKRVV